MTTSSTSSTRSAVEPGPGSSVARREETADSDLDLLVVLDAVDPTERRAIMRQVRGATRTFVPVDVVIADVAEVESDRDDVGSAVSWPPREGETVHRRLARRAAAMGD